MVVLQVERESGTQDVVTEETGVSLGQRFSHRS
jgi:hypothetical protein